MRNSTSMSYVETANRSSSFYMNFSESDLESVDFVTEPTNTQLLLHVFLPKETSPSSDVFADNPGGITIFGWTVDRGLINTIFFIELTVVTFILGKTIVFTVANAAPLSEVHSDVPLNGTTIRQSIGKWKGLN
ncbi:hypothetical protein HAX54_019595 [Datura stramonium]|uniref:Uncharacterized protein n=1 Tax=Datura stramonium TaxID=4076 RepID=A0ABS8S221_DATST|nr:hypothetical protein [Datura stramonium]